MTVYKKDGKYYCHFKIKGKQKHLLCHGAKTHSAALAIEDAEKFKLRQELAGLISSDKKKIYSAAFMFNKFLNYGKKKGKKSLEKDEYQVKELLNYFKSKNLSQDISLIKQKDIEDLQLYLKNTKTLRGEQRENSTVNQYIACLKTAFNLMVKNENIEIYSNPCIGVPCLIEDNRRTTYLPKEKEELFLSLLPETIRDIVMLDLSTGLRAGNVLHAHKSEFDIEGGYWMILKRHNKGKKYIRIKLNNTALAIVKKYYYAADNYLFINPKTNRPYTTYRKYPLSFGLRYFHSMFESSRRLKMNQTF